MNTKSKTSHFKLNQYYATAISGNDILSSALYVSGIACIFAGVYAPVVLAIIALVLYFYKAVYIEVVEALPINGGAYNCLLNGTSKTVAAIAGVTTILSYIATAVISAKVAVEYVNTVIPIPVIPATIGLLFAFAVLVISGLKDSAKVALGIFIFHIFTLVAFLIIGAIFFFKGNSHFWENFQITSQTLSSKGLLMALFFGFSSSLLGVSGFESSANFVEEQAPGVFRKTLRNMLIGVAIFNPLIALVVINSASLGVIANAKDFLLADIARILGGQVFQYLVVVDAFMVLAGAVMTAYIGVGGLIYRMAADACLPGFLTKKNNKGSYPKIVIAFFVLCASILLATKGDLLSLAGVYTIAFLTVMSLFALGNLILRQTRTELKRTYNAPILFVLLALISTTIGIIGNVELNPINLRFFMIYFIPAILLVLAIVYQDFNIQLILNFTKNIPFLHKYVFDHFEDITSGTVIAFINHTNRLHSILQYINNNETARKIILVHCRNWDLQDDLKRHSEIERLIPALQEAGVYPHLDIKLYYENEPFGKKAIQNVSKKFRVRVNRIMIGSIHHFHDFDYSDLDGVRIIF